ncbi:MAG TPA: lipoyl(octanoyl) transferase LipB [Thermoanaerobaculia bacterium]|jgi:lipoyl(octanoyl) transferase|nr:lipoyl(octanoyl) transferase LipB [Thermoanaerobaculia bacterium]
MPEPRRPLHWELLGRVPYAEALALQFAARAALKSGEEPERFFLLEHPHVYTLGRNASGDDVLAGPEWLAARGVEVVECDRGGQVTYHGPGQLVGYPVINLSPDRRDIRRYVRDLQEVLIRTLSGFGIAARPGEGQENIGVWVEEEKIASIGVHLSRWITTHGFALNVATDLSYFSGIIPCGLHQVRMTSIERLMGLTPSLEDVAATVARHFGEIFGRELVAAVPQLQNA